jgi:HSP20 family molecular chaperone IbpA
MSFFDKLKKGMGVEEVEKGAEKNEEEIQTAQEEKPTEKPKKTKVKKQGESEKKTTQVQIENEEEPESKVQTQDKKNNKDNWGSFKPEAEGQLAIDVYQTQDFLVVQSAIAGVKPESLDVLIEGDMLSIKGSRQKPEDDSEKEYSYQECFWGPFSRQIVLSVEVDPSRTEASLKDGILTVKVPKIERERKRKITVKG